MIDADFPEEVLLVGQFFVLLKITRQIHSVVPFHFTLRVKGGASDREHSL